MDFLYAPKGLKRVGPVMPWADIRYLLTPSRISSSKNLKYRGKIIWEMYETASSKSLSRAYFLSPQEGAAFPPGLLLPSADIPLKPLKVQSLNGSAGYRITGNGRPGWVFISEPRYPGWRAWVETKGRIQLAQRLPALKAFQKTRVSQGWSSLFLIYDSSAVHWGIFLTVFSFLLLFFYAASKMGELGKS
jgi:hypothetical protein